MPRLLLLGLDGCFDRPITARAARVTAHGVVLQGDGATCVAASAANVLRLLGQNPTVLASLTRSRSLYGCVQGKEVGLEGDFVDGLDDAGRCPPEGRPRVT